MSILFGTCHILVEGRGDDNMKCDLLYFICCTDKRISTMWLATIAAFALFCCLGSQWMMQVKPAINGIYSQNGPWYHVKYWSFCLLLALQKLAKSKRDLKCLDQTQTFSAEAEQHGNDSIFFIGSCTKTGLTFIVATERRPNNITYGLVYVMVKKKHAVPLVLLHDGI